MNDSFKLSGQPFKNFKQSTLIKFVEFEGSCEDNMESDPNRKISERISDRIYERVENVSQDKG